MTIFTHRFIPKGFDGYTVFCFALVRPEFKDDIGLIEHEKTHVNQFWRLPFLHGLLYMLSKRYRLKSELEAFRVQSKFCTEDRTAFFAERLSCAYGLSITKQGAIDLLKK